MERIATHQLPLPAGYIDESEELGVEVEIVNQVAQRQLHSQVRLSSESVESFETWSHEQASGHFPCLNLGSGDLSPAAEETLAKVEKNVLALTGNEHYSKDVALIVARAETLGIEALGPVTAFGIKLVISPQYVYINIDQKLGTGAGSRFYSALQISRADEAAYSVARGKVYRRSTETREHYEQKIEEAKRSLEILDAVESEYLMPKPYTTVSYDGGQKFTLYTMRYQTDLADWVTTSSEEDRVEALYRMGAGIRDLHQAGYIHRDVKLENALTKGPASTTVVSDVGATSQSEEGISGDRFVLPPESLKENSQTKASDVWSFGVALYRAFSPTNAYPPFLQRAHNSSPFGSAREQISAYKRTMLELSQEKVDHKLFSGWSAPKEIQSVISSCLQINAEERPSMEDVADQLDDLRQA